MWHLEHLSEIILSTNWYNWYALTLINNFQSKQIGAKFVGNSIEY